MLLKSAKYVWDSILSFEWYFYNCTNIPLTHIIYMKQRYEITESTLAAHEETYTYWEPADTVNDLHKQLSSNKYRELLPEQVT